MAERHFRVTGMRSSAQPRRAEVPAHRHRPRRERTTPSIVVQLLQDPQPAILKQVVGVVVVGRIGADRDPDPWTEFPDQLCQQLRITDMETPDVDGICNLSAPSPVDGQPG